MIICPRIWAKGVLSASACRSVCTRSTTSATPPVRCTQAGMCQGAFTMTTPSRGRCRRPPSPQPPPQPGPCLPHRRPCRHQGYFVDYIRALGAIAPWGNLSFHATSAGARMEFNDSRWDAAVQDVKSGITDVAVSDFWVTKRRANMANMDQIYEESVYLFVPRVYAC